MSHYNRSLDEILGLNTAAKPLDTAPIAPPRRLGSRSSENNSSVGSSALAKCKSTIDSTKDRPPTRHGRSSQSESSSSSKLENTVTVERKPGVLNNRNTDVWNREEETHETEVTTLSNGPRRSSNLNRSIQQPSTILEQKRLSSLSSSSPSSGSSFRDEFLVEPRPEQLESNTQPFELTTSSSSQSEDSSSDLSNASQRTYSTKVNENNDSLLNAPIKLPSSASSAESRNKRQTVEEPNKESVKSAVEDSVKMLDRKSTSSSTNKEKTEQLPSKTIESNEQQNGTIRSRPPANISTNRLTQRPRSSTQRPRPEIDIQRSKLKSSMSTRQLLQDNSPNYNLWLQRSLENQKRKNAEERAKKAAEEEKKAEQKANADKAFERWKARYDEKQVKEQRQRKKTAQEQAEEKKRLLDEKRRNAEKTFEHWKKSQDERRKSEELRRKRLDRERAQSVELQKQNQRRENEKAYQVWCETLNERIREDQKIRDAAEYERRTKLEQDRSFKDSLAKEAYQLWLEMKRKEKTYQHSLAYKILDYNAEAKKRWPAVPWLPTTPTVPRRFVGTGNRRRTLDKPLTIVQRRAKSVY